jgi:dihydrodipicolinate synthase/N-acetylneuraminate lyase
MKQMIKGVIVPNLTFFDAEGKVDYDKCQWHMKWLLDKDVDGLFVTGTYGSGTLMSIEERINIFNLAKTVSDKKKGTYVIAHVGCNDTSSAVLLAKEAEKIGLKAVSALNPFNYQYTDLEIIEFYASLRDAVNIPVFAYNNPGMTGRAINFSMVKELEKIGINGIKDSAIDVNLMTSIYSSNHSNGRKFKYITGTTTGWPVFNKMGVDTMISGACNYIPEAVVLLNKFSYIDESKLLEVYGILNDVMKKIKIGNSIVSSHIALKARGFESGFTRLPLIVPYESKSKCIDALSQHIKRALDKCMILELS